MIYYCRDHNNDYIRFLHLDTIYDETRCSNTSSLWQGRNASAKNLNLQIKEIFLRK